jgi:Pilus formation protein N terminal region
MFLHLFVRRVLAGSCFVLLVWPVAAQDILTLEIDRAKIVELPAGIADATVLRRQNRIVLTARAYGQTNMIALDTRGQALAEVMLVVKNAEVGLVVQRGLERETWTCSPRCEPAISPGDSARHTGEAIKQAGQHGGFARPNAPAAK